MPTQRWIYPSVRLFIWTTSFLSFHPSPSIYLSVSPICVSVHISVHFSVYSSTHPSVCPSIYLSVYPIGVSVHLSVYPHTHIHLSARPFMCLSLPSVCLFIYLSIYPPIRLYVRPSDCPSFHQFISWSVWVERFQTLYRLRNGENGVEVAGYGKQTGEDNELMSCKTWRPYNLAFNKA